jgi:hypothetical protein
MPTNHEAVGTFGAGAISTAAVRNLLVRRLIYPIASTENPQDFVAVDPSSGVLPIGVAYNGRLFWLDSADGTTVHDGLSTVVSYEGKRYKRDAIDPPVSVLDKDLTAPPGSPTIGAAYLVPAAATGAWAGQTGKIAVYTARGWEFVVSPVGRLVYVQDETSFYHRTVAGTWQLGAGSQVITSGIIAPSSMIGGGARVRWLVENQSTNTPPAVVNGTAYVVGPSPTGAWAGHVGKIAHGENGAWVLYTPAAGWTVYDKALGADYRYSGTAWVSAAGAWLARGSVFTASGSSVFESTGSGYVYSDTVAPTTAATSQKDSATLSVAAPRAGAKIVFDYEGYTGNAASMVAIGLFRDAEVTALDWRSMAQQNVRATFEISASDAVAHTYSVRIFHSSNASVPVFPGRRLFRYEVTP